VQDHLSSSDFWEGSNWLIRRIRLLIEPDDQCEVKFVI